VAEEAHREPRPAVGRATWTAPRPDYYFDSTNPDWPAVATLRLSIPPLTIPESIVREQVTAELERLETEARAAVLAHGWRVFGRSRVSNLSPFQRARSWEPLRGRNPTFAVGRGQRAAFFLAVEAVRAFRDAYRAALLCWRIGMRGAVFPAETWLMRTLHAATLAT
jgi:hypothetical protein